MKSFALDLAKAAVFAAVIASPFIIYFGWFMRP